MSSSTDLQSLLRFLSGPCKIPLATAMSKVKPLIAEKLNSIDAIASSDIETIQKLFPDEKTAKQVLSAAKRASKKKPKTNSTTTTKSPTKRKRGSSPLVDDDRTVSWEDGLALPEPITDEDKLYKVKLTSNRAPLLLAFAVVSLGYTHPWLPLSSRFSLAQGLLELTAAAKAKSIGIERKEEGKPLEEGYHKMRVLGREIPVLRRWDTTALSASTNNESSEPPTKITKQDEDSTRVDSTTKITEGEDEQQPAFWALSTELLEKPPAPTRQNPNALPIHLPQPAHGYLVRSFPANSTLPQLLGALKLLYDSWADTLDAAELERRSWSWYIRVRPDVADGKAGWGGKGEIPLSKILDLRRPS